MILKSVSIMYTSNKYPRIDNITDAYLWHCRFGYINKNKINRLTQEKILDINNYESLLTYESYLLKKMIRTPFTRKDEWASDVLGLVYSDICGPMNIGIKRGYYNFITLIDDLSRYVYVYLMKYKSESFEMFKQFCGEIKK